MNANRLGGYALCASALINVLLTIWYTIGGDDLAPVKVAGLVGSVLLMLGLLSLLPPLQRLQSGVRRAGEWGLMLMVVAAFLSLALNLYFMAGGAASNIAAYASLISAILELIGVLLVGYVTIRTSTFPVGAGWLLIAGGVLNFIGGVITLETLTYPIGLISAFMVSGALVGFGLRILCGPEGRFGAEGPVDL